MALLVMLVAATARAGFCLVPPTHQLLVDTGFTAVSDLSESDCSSGGFRWCPLKNTTKVYSKDGISVEYYSYSACCGPTAPLLQYSGDLPVDDPSFGLPTCRTDTPALKCSASMWTTKLKKDILANVDSGVPPGKTLLHPDEPGGRTDASCSCSDVDCLTEVDGKCLACKSYQTCSELVVKFGINYYKVVQLDLTSSDVRLSAWIRLTWADERLAYDPQCYGGLESIGLRAEPGNPGSGSEIWTPDIELYNNQASIWTGESHQLRSAIVYSCSRDSPDRSSCGSVFWSRPGILEALCKYEGLEFFPFDALVCKLEFAAWVIDGRFQDIQPYGYNHGAVWADMPDKPTDSGVGITAGSSWQDYTIQNLTAERILAYYTSSPAPYPEIVHTLTFKRAQPYYVAKLIIPTLMLTVTSFTSFVMSPGGDRIGFGISVIFTQVAVDLYGASLLPISSQRTYFDYVNFISFVFCVAALLESAIVECVYIQDSQSSWMDVLVPDWMKPIQKKARDVELEKEVAKAKNIMSRLSRQMTGDTSKNDMAGSESIAAETLRSKETKQPEKRITRKDRAELDMRKHIYFEFFCVLDQDNNGSISIDELIQAIHLSPQQDGETPEEYFRRFDVDGSGSIDFDEFCQFCETMFNNAEVGQDYTRSMITGVIENLKRNQDFRAMVWKNYAASIDTFALRVIPLAYVSFLVAIANISEENFQSWDAVVNSLLTIGGGNVFLIVVYVPWVVLIFIFVLFHSLTSKVQKNLQ
jgi:hypothetical protein